jgi:ABC-2 type transport system ATP-binding protein
VYTTHYLAELDDLDATLAVIDAGRVVARGHRATLLAHLPSRVRVEFAPPPGSAGGQALEVVETSFDPATTVAELLASGGQPRAVDNTTTDPGRSLRRAGGQRCVVSARRGRWP